MKKVKIVVSTGEKNYIYNGYVIEDSDGWLTIDDERDGRLKLNKSQIVSIKELGDSR